MPKTKKKQPKEEKKSKNKKEVAVKKSSKKTEKEGKKKKKVSVESKKSKKEEPIPKKSKKDKKKEVTEFFNPYKQLDEELDTIDKEVGEASGLNMKEQRTSTGLLMLDILVNKGIIPGWYTVFGPEQSCKSTVANTILFSGLKQEVPINSAWDYEGSGDPIYLTAIANSMGLKLTADQIFGVEDPKTGKWIVPPVVRYKKPRNAEAFFDYVMKLQRKLPDKVMMGDKWFYVYENTKINRKLVGDSYDKNYLRKANKFKVPARDGALQALVLVDSYVGMLPGRLEDENAGAGIGAQARMFSDQIKRVKGGMAMKRIAIVGVNQLRQKPMVMYGDPSYEPGGESLKFFSDVRISFKPRALSSAPGSPKGKGMIESENSITTKGGTDTYRYIHARIIKNKLGAPNYLEGWLRLWITNADDEPKGFDPVFDTFSYLVATGQIEHKAKKNIVISIKGKEAKKSIDWYEFKTLILGDKKARAKVYEKIKLKPFNLREFCFNQLGKGSGYDMYLEHKKIGTAEAAAKAKEKVSEEDDDG